MGTRRLTEEEIQKYLDRHGTGRKKPDANLSPQTQEQFSQYRDLYNRLGRQPKIDLPNTFASSILTRLSMGPSSETDRWILHVFLSLTCLLAGVLVSAYWLSGTSTQGLLEGGKQILQMFALLGQQITDAGFNLKLMGLGCTIMMVLAILDNLICQVKGHSISK